MSFCTKCGKQLNEGDIFCTSCGTPVASTTNESNQANNAAATTEYQFSSNNAAEYFKKAFESFLSTITEPISTVKSVSSSLSICPALILALVVSIFSGLLGIWQAAKLSNTIGGTVGGAFGSSPFGELASGSVTSSMQSSIPYGSIFVYFLLGILLFDLLLALIIFLVDKFIIKKCNYFAAYFSVTTVALIPIILFSYVALIISYISFTLSVGVLIFGSMQGLILLFVGAKELIKSDKATLYTVSGAYALTIFVELFVAYHYILSCIGNI